MTLTDKMKAWEPAAVWSEAGEGMFTVPAEAFRGVAERLKAEGFDFLRSLTGMDRGEAMRCNSSMIVRMYCTRSGTSTPSPFSMHMQRAWRFCDAPR